MSDTSRMAQNKLILLYLVAKMGVPLSNSEICQFALEKNYMDYFTVQQYLSELVESSLLEMTKENNITRYTVTDDGSDMLSFFLSRMGEAAKSDILQYVQDNGRRIKAEYEVTANYFLEMNDEYSVKCGLYDTNSICLMEISALVATKEQARAICNNWKKNVTRLYGTILNSLISQPAEPEAVHTKSPAPLADTTKNTQ